MLLLMMMMAVTMTMTTTTTMALVRGSMTMVVVMEVAMMVMTMTTTTTMLIVMMMMMMMVVLMRGRSMRGKTEMRGQALELHQCKRLEINAQLCPSCTFERQGRPEAPRQSCDSSGGGCLHCWCRGQRPARPPFAALRRSRQRSRAQGSPEAPGTAPPPSTSSLSSL